MADICISSSAFVHELQLWYVHHQANNDYRLRFLLGLENDKFWLIARTEYDYQQIYDNVSRISDEMLVKINAVVVAFGHNEVYKKRKYNIALKNR